MLAKLGLQLSVLEVTECLWEADDDHTGALDVQDLVGKYCLAVIPMAIASASDDC